eukprot:GHVR01136795.1.p1 GENE.GHVR01136795.1~~GHVR01136795.1.p1  ORF type:complete len:196 (-),score=27.58 GHVR01136795.1:37-624(-)
MHSLLIKRSFLLNSNSLTVKSVGMINVIGYFESDDYTWVAVEECTVVSFPRLTVINKYIDGNPIYSKNSHLLSFTNCPKDTDKNSDETSDKYIWVNDSDNTFVVNTFSANTTHHSSIQRHPLYLLHQENGNHYALVRGGIGPTSLLVYLLPIDDNIDKEIKFYPEDIVAASHYLEWHTTVVRRYPSHSNRIRQLY